MAKDYGNLRTLGHFNAGNCVAMFLADTTPNVRERAIIEAMTRPEPCCALLVIGIDQTSRRSESYSLFTCDQRRAVPEHVRANGTMVQVYDRKTGEGLTPGARRVWLANSIERDGFNIPDDQVEQWA